MIEHELWSFNNALFLLIFIIILVFVLTYGISKIFNVRNVKNNWAEQRCSPMIMPFASIFGFNTKENFEFCMGKIFNTHSMPFFGSIGHMFTNFTNLLTIIFDSLSSLRNTIASLGGGINVIFQEFTERISNFFFKLRLSAIHIKTLMGRMYAILFSVMYMSLSGITGVTSFTNTFLFSFLNVFCFPGETKLNIKDKGYISIKDIKIGDIIHRTNAKVTATFRFFSKGQPMVKLGSIIVSTNHYVLHSGKLIKAGDHPDAKVISNWESNEPLYCLNTSDNKIPINEYIFLDYDETNEGDKSTMNYIDGCINANFIDKEYKFKEYCPAISNNTLIKTKNGLKLAKDIKIGDKLTTGSEVIGLICREVNEICKLSSGTIITPSTLFWNETYNKWERIGEKIEIIKKNIELVSFIVVPNSQIELDDGLRIRDYMELCSPDSEIHYSNCLENKLYKY
jgi:hypothetical protein